MEISLENLYVDLLGLKGLSSLVLTIFSLIPSNNPRSLCDSELDPDFFLFSQWRLCYYFRSVGKTCKLQLPRKSFTHSRNMVITNRPPSLYPSVHGN